MSKPMVVVAMSGGVDSSVSAALLKEAGYEAVGVYMQLWHEERSASSRVRPVCCSHRDADDARRVCQLLDIPFYIFNFEAQFQRYVIDYFCGEYSQGRTPNPCIVCNQQIKFNLLLRQALSLGAQYLATGHYARIQESDNGYHLLKGMDPSNDQSYFLYTLGQGDLQRLLFPLGDCRKAQVRRMAAERGLPVADKPKSQDLCFVPDRRYPDFVREYVSPSPGNIVDIEGNVLGRHKGIAFYTIGQRTGLGIAAGRRLYVIAINAMANSVVVGSEDQLFASRLVAGSARFVSRRPESPIAVKAKIRYKSPEIGATLHPRERGMEVLFDKPQRAISPGQAVVLYQGDQVLGGGVIEAS